MSILFSQKVFAQSSDTIGNLSMSAYVDVYAATYTDSTAPGGFEQFPTTSPRNGFGLNMAMYNVKYTSDKVRATMTLQFGDIPNSAWASELVNLQKAHIGVRLLKKLWLDGGFFRTHFGTEYLMPNENIASSISVGTYYEPYYESGFRLNWNPTDKWEINLYLLNGYNIYQETNNSKSVGLAVSYTVNDNLGVGYTNYLGDDTPLGQSQKHLRFLHNVYLNYEKGKIKLQAGADFGTQQHSDTANFYTSAKMWSALLIGRYALANSFGMYARVATFHDPQGFLSGRVANYSSTKAGLEIYGLTAGMEYKPTDNSYIRLEGRYLDAQADMFYYKGTYRTFRYELMVNMGVSFQLLNRFLTKK